MAHEIDLHFLRQYAYHPDYTDVMDILEAWLPRTLGTSAKAAGITEDLHSLAIRRSEDSGGFFCQLWTVIHNAVRIIPTDHAWQDTLVRVTGNLSQLESPAQYKNKLKWSELPYFHILYRDFYFDPTDLDEDECTPDLVSKFKSHCSYAARLDKMGIWKMGISYPIWQMRDAFEEPVKKGASIDIKLWIAIDWILNSIQPLWEFILSREYLEERFQRAYSVGELGKDTIPILGIKRWCFWKSRLLDFARDFDTFGFESVTPDMIDRALERMDKVESDWEGAIEYEDETASLHEVGGSWTVRRQQTA